MTSRLRALVAEMETNSWRALAHLSLSSPVRMPTPSPVRAHPNVL